MKRDAIGHKKIAINSEYRHNKARTKQPMCSNKKMKKKCIRMNNRASARAHFNCFSIRGHNYKFYFPIFFPCHSFQSIFVRVYLLFSPIFHCMSLECFSLFVCQLKSMHAAFYSLILVASQDACIRKYYCHI